MNESGVPISTSAHSLLDAYGKMRTLFRGDEGRAHSDLAKLAKERVGREMFSAKELASKEEKVM